MTRFMDNEGNEMDHSDSEVSPAEHSRLLTAISQLDSKQRVKPPSRKEPSLQVSEFHLVQSGEGKDNAVHLFDLAKALTTDSKHVQISNKLKAIKRKGRTLPKPLEKPVAERIQRTVGFKKVRKQVTRWEPIVQKNRVADHLSFPLNQDPIVLNSSKEFFKRFKTQSPLETQIAEILSQSQSAIEDKEKAEKEFPLSLEELAERRKEMAKLRLQQSYEAAKARRQGKIKSKKYHRVLRREKLRKQIKDFETLQKTDPEAALEQLQQLERARAKERMTLRHRNTGQWARSRAIRAKYDPQSRQALAEQLAVSRDLTKKLQKETDSSEEEAEENVGTNIPSGRVEANSNPWITPSSEVHVFLSGYRQYWEKHSKEMAEKKKESTEALENSLVTHSKLPSVVSHELHANAIDSDSEGRQQDEPPSDQEASVNSGNLSSEDEESIRTVDKPLEDVEFISNITKMGEKTSQMESGLSKKQGKMRTLVKISPPINNVNRATNGLTKCEENNLGETQPTVKGTSSWVVTPINLTNSKKKCTPGKKKGNKDKIICPVKASKAINTRKTADSKTVNVDDIFENMVQKLKDKVSVKLSELKNDIKTSNKLVCTQTRKVNAKAVDEPSLAMQAKTKRPQEDVHLTEEPGQHNQSHTSTSFSIPVVPKIGLGEQETSGNQKDDVDPNKFLSVKPKVLQTQLPDMVNGGDECLDDDDETEETQQMTITEAFTGDDVISEFAKEKEDEQEKSRPKDVDLSLPGWGSWGGKNLPTSTRKKPRCILKFPEVVKRRDENKGHLIINENKETKILQHQVSEVPFPFTTVKDFEASIRAPVGNTWVPETAHRRLIKPPVETKLGTIIRAMDEDILVNKTKKVGVI